MSAVNPLSFINNPIESYDPQQDLGGTSTVSNNGNTLTLTGNTWKKISLPYTITANTILSFDFQSTSQGDLHAIGFDTDNVADLDRSFSLYGTSRQGNRAFYNYLRSVGSVRSYMIPVGAFFTGSMNYLTFINDNDTQAARGNSTFSNVRLYERLVLSNDTTSVNRNNTLTLGPENLLRNDVGTNLRVIGVDGAVNGTVQLNDRGNIVFNPNFGFNGAAGFDYTVVDRDGKTARARVNVTVNNFNNPPVAGNDSFSLYSGNPLTVAIADLLGNDRDPDGDTLQLVSVNNANRGQVTLDGKGNVIFTPETNYVGDASFQYTIRDSGGATANALVNLVVKPGRKAPTAVDDNVTGLKNTPVVLSAAALLGNDTGEIGANLKVTGVSNASNGSVSLDNEGGIRFTPNPNFTGNAGFSYTIEDVFGGKTTAKVNLNVIRPAIGTNLNKISDWSPQLPFIDAFKSSRQWFWNGGDYSTTTANQDANGWLTTINTPGANVDGAATLLLLNLKDKYPTGRYVVLYDGEGSINYRFSAAKDHAASRPGRDILDVTSSNDGILLSISSTNPDNYIRNIRVMPLERENSTEIFNPAFLDSIAPYSTLRFMDWMRTNNSNQITWNDRPKVEQARWSDTGVPVEIMVALANKTDSDPWFTMPHMADNNYITNFARYVKNNLEPGRKVYIEYSNEAWNWGFEQTRWVDNRAKSEGLNNMQWFGKRSAEIAGIWKGVFGNESDRVVGVLGAQAANPWTATEALNYIRTGMNTTPKAAGIDAVAIAPYFGGYLGDPARANEVQGWTNEADGGLNKLFDELTRGGVVSNGPAGGALAEASQWISSYTTLTRQENLQLIAYEGGQHLVGYFGNENNQAITDLFIRANRDPRMGQLYQQYLTDWYQQGGGLFVNYSDVGNYSKWGSWGSMEHLGDTNAPKYRAIVNTQQNI